MQTFDPAFEQDLARQQPDESILTVLRACTVSGSFSQAIHHARSDTHSPLVILQITHLLVMQALIVNVRIERAALVPTRPDGDTLMRTNPRNVDSAYSAEAFRISIKCAVLRVVGVSVLVRC